MLRAYSKLNALLRARSSKNSSSLRAAGQEKWSRKLGQESELPAMKHER